MPVRIEPVPAINTTMRMKDGTDIVGFRMIKRKNRKLMVEARIQIQDLW
jgi:hypothetical protein